MRVIDIIAQAAHDANRAYCMALGKDVQPPWDEAPETTKQSLRDGVKFHLVEDGGFDPEKSHARWMETRGKQGWRYGPIKDEAKGIHPCFLPYHELPEDQKVKDRIFVSVVRAVWFALNSMRVATDPGAMLLRELKISEEGEDV